jgi:hypothetical protein
MPDEIEENAAIGDRMEAAIAAFEPAVRNNGSVGFAVEGDADSLGIDAEIFAQLSECVSHANGCVLVGELAFEEMRTIDGGAYA